MISCATNVGCYSLGTLAAKSGEISEPRKLCHAASFDRFRDPKIYAVKHAVSIGIEAQPQPHCLLYTNCICSCASVPSIWPVIDAHGYLAASFPFRSGSPSTFGRVLQQSRKSILPAIRADSALYQFNTSYFSDSVLAYFSFTILPANLQL